MIETNSRLSVASLPKISDSFTGELNLLFLKRIAEHFGKWLPVIKAGCRT
jgi:hypothetical protein